MDTCARAHTLTSFTSVDSQQDSSDRKLRQVFTAESIDLIRWGCKTDREDSRNH